MKSEQANVAELQARPDSLHRQPQDVFIKPSVAARRLGVSMATFWNRAKTDPAFPAMFYDKETGMAYLIERALEDYRNARYVTTPSNRAQRARERRAA